MPLRILEMAIHISLSADACNSIDDRAGPTTGPEHSKLNAIALLNQTSRNQTPNEFQGLHYQQPLTADAAPKVLGLAPGTAWEKGCIILIDLEDTIKRLTHFPCIGLFWIKREGELLTWRESSKPVCAGLNPISKNMAFRHENGEVVSICHADCLKRCMAATVRNGNP